MSCVLKDSDARACKGDNWMFTSMHWHQPLALCDEHASMTGDILRKLFIAGWRMTREQTPQPLHPESCDCPFCEEARCR